MVSGYHLQSPWEWKSFKKRKFKLTITKVNQKYFVIYTLQEWPLHVHSILLIVIGITPDFYIGLPLGKQVPIVYAERLLAW